MSGVSPEHKVEALRSVLSWLASWFRWLHQIQRGAWEECGEGSRERQHQCREVQPSHLHPQREHGRRKGPSITVSVQQPSSVALGIVHIVTVEFCGKCLFCFKNGDENIFTYQRAVKQISSYPTTIHGQRKCQCLLHELSVVATPPSTYCR